MEKFRKLHKNALVGILENMGGKNKITLTPKNS